MLLGLGVLAGLFLTLATSDAALLRVLRGADFSG